MRAAAVLALLVLASAGCLGAGKPAPGGGPSSEVPSPSGSDSSPDLAPVHGDGPADVPWWMPCDFQAFLPSPARDAWTDRRPLHIAHQGGESEVPSATMYALKTAIRKGADMLEVDVHATADGELVLLHDTTVDRTTEGTGNVEDLTLAEVQALDAAYWFVPGRNAVHDAPAADYALRGIRTGD